MTALDDQLQAASEEALGILAAAMIRSQRIHMGASHGLADRVTSCTPCAHLVEVPVQVTYALLGQPGTADCAECFHARARAARAARVRVCSDCAAEVTGLLQQVVGQLLHITVVRLLCDPCQIAAGVRT